MTPDAAAQRAEEVAAGFVGSMSLGNGQFCTKPGLLFVPAGAGLEDRVAALAGERAGGADAERTHPVGLLGGAGRGSRSGPAYG